jgi:hypothetical protein
MLNTANARIVRVSCSGRYVEIRGNSSALLLPLLLEGANNSTMSFVIEESIIANGSSPTFGTG